MSKSCCQVKGCEAIKPLYNPHLIIPRQGAGLPPYTMDCNFPLCKEHADNVRSPQELFENWDDFVQAIRSRAPYPKSLMFSETEVMFKEIV